MKDLKQLKIPDRLKSLKVDPRGYPIPFFIPIDKDGKPDFKYMDARKQMICVKYKVCMICGQPLNKNEFYYISGPVGLKNKVASDPAMHEECAKFSLEICPHMLFQKAKRTSEDQPEVKDIFMDTKPDQVFLVGARKFEVVNHKGYLISNYSNLFYTQEYRYDKEGKLFEYKVE